MNNALAALLVLWAVASPVRGRQAPPKSEVTLPEPTGPSGGYSQRWEFEQGWAKLPADRKLGPTHGGVAVDSTGNVFVSSDGPEGIIVFGRDGTFLRSIAAPFAGIHGLVLCTEDGVQYLYGAHLLGRQVVKLTLNGELVWNLPFPAESGIYRMADEFRPTAVAVAPDGRIFVADGYGASVIHEFSPDRTWRRTIGAKGFGEGEFNNCHGLALDTRSGVPLLLVCDRDNRRLVYFNLDGNFVRTLATNLRRPCSVAFIGKLTAVAELEGRVVLLDDSGSVVSKLGDNPDQEQWATNRVPPEQWQPDIFLSPHGIAFDHWGNLYVLDWNRAVRISRLRRVPSPP